MSGDRVANSRPPRSKSGSKDGSNSGLDPKIIKELVLNHGFDCVGITDAAGILQAGSRLKEFIGLERHGTMDWLKDRFEWRADPKVLWPDVQSIIMMGINYGPNHDPLELLQQGSRGNISVYARHKDYHDVVKKRLKKIARQLVADYDCQLKVFVDTAPVMEKPLAMAAGLGWQGKHTNVVSNDFGSWLFIGAIFLDFQLDTDQYHGDQCGSCTACLDICPTNAFPAPYQLDARRCISYLTIEHKGPVDEDLRPLLGNRIYGCDDCLAVCPWNKFAKTSSEAAFHARAELQMPKLADLALLDDASFRALFSGSPIKRIGRNRFVRNVLYAIGNSGDKALAKTAEKLMDDPSFIVADAAEWATSRLG